MHLVAKASNKDTVYRDDSSSTNLFTSKRFCEVSAVIAAHSSDKNVGMTASFELLATTDSNQLFHRVALYRGRSVGGNPNLLQTALNLNLRAAKSLS
jgi:hypothetical protein